LGAPAQADAYDTIGQFYDAIRRGLLEVCTELGEAAVFCGAPARQVTPEFSYGGAGRVIAVHDLDSALAALGEIVEQGEGASRCQVWDGDHDMFHPERDEVGHYYRLEELRVGRRFRRGDTPQTGPSGEPIGIDWDGVRRMQVNQRIADRVPGDPIRTAQEAFNSSYCRLLALLDSSFNGHPELLGAAVGGMYDLKRQAEELIRMPTGNGFTAGPTFEYVAPERR
jgi:hypothetical protein